MVATRSDKLVAARDECVVRNVLDRHAREQGDKVFIATPEGRTLTYKEIRTQVLKTAGALHGMGVRKGGYVMSWLPNGLDIVNVLLATNYLGAIHVPINTAYRGGILEHVIRNSGATVIVAHNDLVGRLSDVGLGELKHLVVVGGEARGPAGLEAHGADIFQRAEPVGAQALEGEIEPWDTQSIIYTSGTTGPSKGVLSSYFHLWSMGQATCYYAGQDDRSLCYLPFFHAASLAGFMKMLCDGGSVGLVSTFDTKKFWQDANATQSTTAMMLGSVATFLAKQGQTEAERSTTLKTLLGAPLNADAKEIGKRSGLEVYACWNMTETSTPLISEANPTKPGTCGVVRSGIAARLVDAFDREVPVGEVGELVLRSDAPWAMNSGYHKDPEATARAWRNGWFHTGDAFRMDKDGEFFFVDRIKDAIRRRGENISSMEVEREVNAFPDVADSAAVAVPSEFGEDDVLVVVEPRPGQTIDPAALLDFLTPRMAHFMVPRYVRFIEKLPKTPTMKTEKHLLRKDGVTPDTWDREKAGIKVRRDRFNAA
jgi:crotonobetaine/carnitine-CoA ligase